MPGSIVSRDIRVNSIQYILIIRVSCICLLTNLTHFSFVSLHRLEKIELPCVHVPTEVKQGEALPFYVSSHTVNKCQCFTIYLVSHFSHFSALFWKGDFAI